MFFENRIIRGRKKLNFIAKQNKYCTITCEMIYLEKVEMTDLNVFFLMAVKMDIKILV